MAFEYYTRSGTKMLRCGYTTGTCAALAATAATWILLSGKAPEKVGLMTAKGIPVEVPVEEFGAEMEEPEEFAAKAGKALPKTAWAAIPKDAGDDADVTDGLLIRADVARTIDSGVHIDGGKGVGVVTKPGLDQPIGNAAINSGPRRMIEESVQAVCQEMGYARGIRVIISVPGGEEAAKKTFNSNLGIRGGISILGTSGIVEPMSEQALVDTIEVELRQIAAESRQLILTPGNYGSDFITGHDLDALGIPVLKFSNFLGETLDMIAGTEIETVLLVAHVGKLSKVAAGIMNTHSKYADGRNEIFCAHAAICGGSTQLCRELMSAATTDACIELLDGGESRGEDMNACGEDVDTPGEDMDAPGEEMKAGEEDVDAPGGDMDAGGEDMDAPGKEGGDFRRQVIGSILDAVQSKLEHRAAGAFRIGALMFSNMYGPLGVTEEGARILRQWESGEQANPERKA